MCLANKKELATDLIVKAKQVEYLIQSLPEPEAEEVQVRDLLVDTHARVLIISEAKRLEALENEMGQANDEYLQAVNRASTPKLSHDDKILTFEPRSAPRTDYRDAGYHVERAGFQPG